MCYYSINDQLHNFPVKYIGQGSLSMNMMIKTMVSFHIVIYADHNLLLQQITTSL